MNFQLAPFPCVQHLFDRSLVLKMICINTHNYVGNQGVQYDSEPTRFQIKAWFYVTLHIIMYFSKSKSIYEEFVVIFMICVLKSWKLSSKKIWNHVRALRLDWGVSDIVLGYIVVPSFLTDPGRLDIRTPIAPIKW